MSDNGENSKKIKHTDVDKKKSSLVINYEKKAEEKKVEDQPKKKVKKRRKKDQNAPSEELEEFKEQLEQLKGIKKFFKTELSKSLLTGIKLFDKINLKYFGRRRKKDKQKTEADIEVKKTEIVEEKFTFTSLISLNVIFTDNKKIPLYLPAKQQIGMYAQNDEVLYSATIGKIFDVLRETAQKLKRSPIPEQGKYEGIPLNEVFAQISEKEVLEFLFYVKRFPSKYIGKNYRFSESFAAWIMSGTPDK